MKKRLTINRRGTFSLKTTSSNQCKAEGHKKYKYYVKATCAPFLDSDGFVIDHVRIDQQVQKAVIASSCERLCILIANRLHAVFHTHGADLRKIYVKVQPVVRNLTEPIAYMEYEEEYPNQH